MAVNPSPWGPKPQFIDSNGNPMSGAKLYWYGAGGSTKTNTYTTSTGGVANSNPITLDSRGEPPSEIWLTAGTAYKALLTTDTVNDPPSTSIWTVDNIRGINDTTVTVDQWVTGPTPTFISTTSFSLSGDQTTAFHVGRRVKTVNGGGTVYSTITASSFGGGITTVTVANDSGTLDSSISAVSYGLLSADNPSTPLLTDAYPIVSGSADKTKKLRIEVDGFTTATTRVQTPPNYDHRVMSQTHGADIASASTVDLDAATGDLVDVTGTTTITAITLSEGRTATVRFTGALTLTHGASLVLPSAANITTAAGDFAVFRGYASSVVRCESYVKASGYAVKGGYWDLIQSQTATNASSVDFTTGITSTYDAYVLVMTKVVPQTDNTDLYIRGSTNGGGAFLTTNSYAHSRASIDGAGTVAGAGANPTDQIIVRGGLGTNTGEHLNAVAYFQNLADTVVYKGVHGTAQIYDSGAAPGTVVFGGTVLTASAVNALRVLMSSGNINGKFDLYGVRKS